MHKNDQKKTILITGCSSGFGLLMAARFASKGHNVIATMRNLDKKSSLLSEANKRDAELDIIQLDVTNKDSIEKAFVYIAEKYGHIDVLINNAGFGIGGFFEDLNDEEIREQLDVNLFGVQNITRAAIPLMRPRRNGKIINISSVSGFSASPCFGAYSTSKWALEAFSESLKYELELFGIEVLLIEPGTYKTEIFYKNSRYAKNFDDPESPYYNISQKLRDKVMKFVAECEKDPEEVAILAEKLVNRKWNSFRNHPNWNARALFLLRKFLPFSIYSWLLKKSLSKELKQ